MVTLSDEEIERIEAYQKGELKGDALVAFETRLVSSPEFAREVNAYGLIMAGIKSKGEQDFEKTVAGWERDANNPPVHASSPSLRRILAIAASVLILIVPLGLWLNNLYKTSSSDQLFKDYFHPYDDVVSSRGGSAMEEVQLSDGMIAYNMADYPKAIATFQIVLEQNPQQEIARFYQGVAYLAVDQVAEAELNFTAIKKLKSSPFVEPAEWYLVLTYLRANDKEAATNQLNRIVSSRQHEFIEEANELRRTMQPE
jgi:tetratricopeptide (TPR) repeat protein